MKVSATVTKTWKEQAAREFAERIKSLGFVVYMAEKGTYGFITDETESRVLSFSMEDMGSLSGNYGPPSQKSGTGWKMDTTPGGLQTAEDVRRALYAMPPRWCGDGWKRVSSVKDYLDAYGASSKFEKI